MKYFFSVCLTMAILPNLNFAQDIPTTNIYLFELEQESDSVFLFKSPKYLTDFNKDGYNNQPCFIRENELLISVRKAGEEQNDIYSLNLEKGTKLQITKTVESEYSPTLMPDLYNFSSIRVEADENGTQRLWQFPISRQNDGKPVFEYLIDIGYHQWLDKYRVVLFIVDEPNYMVIADVREGSTEQLATNIGRSLKIMNNGNLAYIHKPTDSVWYIKELNSRTLRSEIIVETLPGSEDFTIMADGTFLMGRGTKLFKFHPEKNENWIEIGDFRDYNISSITRLEVSKGGKLALVGS